MKSGNDFDRWFRLFVNGYRDKVTRFVSLFVNDRMTCEEVASDVFVSVWQHRDEIPEIEHIDNYLFIIAKNKALNRLRLEKHVNIDIDDIDADAFCFTDTTPESIYISKEIAEELNRAINELPSRTRMAFMLVREQKKTYNEAAEILSVSPKTIEKQVTSATTKLREKLKHLR
ncbi:MAG: RNA polymerase sigma-70 factor [Tannerella sp.]|jgi:RNA polymerase sigma-70 factor (ECF subfamily)|nr:RNA polymerase sigma-70 factor [Tannerella sp.]